MKIGDVVWIEFPGVVQIKRRPAVVLSSATYHAARPDAIFGLLTSQTAKAVAPTDHVLVDWQAAGLRLPSAFRAFLVTLPRTSVLGAIGELTVADRSAVLARVRIALEFS